MKRNIAVLCGGTSGEREISLLTAGQVVDWLRECGQYEPYMVDVQGASWRYAEADGGAYDVDKNTFGLSLPKGYVQFEAAFIANHGTPGENGLLQGYLEMMGIPFTTGGVFTEALTFHKSACKRYLAGLVPMAESVDLHSEDVLDVEAVSAKLGYPLFVKPNDNGSSVGVHRVASAEELPRAVDEAFSVSQDVMLEQGIAGREISCGMVCLGGRDVVLPLAEIVSPAAFFDYQTKYDGSTQEICPAPIPEEEAERIRGYMRTIYHRLGCRGMARADFIVADGVPYFLEINTVPGMTAQSIVPRMVRTMGWSMPELLGQLVDEAIGSRCGAARRMP